MPFYEYQCQACGAQVEVMQKISDPPLRKCPECAKSRLVKLVSAPVFRLKGSGWYETDFKSDSDKKRNLAGAEKEAPAAAGEAKPASDAVKPEPAKPATDSKPAADKPAAKPVRSASASRSKAKPARRPAKTGRT